MQNFNVNPALRLNVISVLPEMFSTIRDYGVLGRAIEQQRIELTLTNPRDYTTNKHRTVDDRPYGGGPGMLMMAEPLIAAIQSAKQTMPEPERCRVIYLSPQGQQLTQPKVQELAVAQQLIFIAGRYEGIDERVVENYVDETLSIGDYILSGGELAAMVVIDAMARLIPGVLGHQESAQSDSFSDGLLEYPQYTRPETIHGNLDVPKILLSGDHAKIAKWRSQQSLGRTWSYRPELLNNLALTRKQQQLLAEYQIEFRQKNKPPS